MIQSDSNGRSAYSVRIMASLAMSLLVVGLAFNIPVSFERHPTPWRMPGPHSAPALGFTDVGSDAALSIPVLPVPVAGVDTAPTVPDDAVVEEPPSDHTHAADSSVKRLELYKIAHRPVLDFAEDMPEIEGGLAAYYIHIEYPEEAKRRGIQGRLVLGFVVEPDGTTSNVHVMDGLHPLCDSAAVRALRQTVFIPGHHKGQPRRVRMRLPVRFKLIDADSSDHVIGQTGTGNAAPPYMGGYVNEAPRPSGMPSIQYSTRNPDQPTRNTRL